MEYKPNSDKELNNPNHDAEVKIETERKLWFMNHIGQTVYGLHSGVNDENSNTIYSEGLVIEDIDHALYLYGIEKHYHEHGEPMRFFETKEERSVYEQALNEMYKPIKIGFFQKLKLLFTRMEYVTDPRLVR